MYSNTSSFTRFKIFYLDIVGWGRNPSALRFLADLVSNVYIQIGFVIIPNKIRLSVNFESVCAFQFFTRNVKKKLPKSLNSTSKHYWVDGLWYVRPNRNSFIIPLTHCIIFESGFIKTKVYSLRHNPSLHRQLMTNIALLWWDKSPL